MYKCVWKLLKLSILMDAMVKYLCDQMLHLFSLISLFVISWARFDKSISIRHQSNVIYRKNSWIQWFFRCKQSICPRVANKFPIFSQSISHKTRSTKQKRKPHFHSFFFPWIIFFDSAFNRHFQSLSIFGVCCSVYWCSVFSVQCSPASKLFKKEPF